MAYRFKKNEAIPQAIQRVFAEEISWAVGHLSNAKRRDQAIHEARKSVKKIRGLLSLCASALGAQYKKEDRYFRDTAARLSDLRDTAVVLDLFDSLAAKLDPADVPALNEIRLNLLRSQRELLPEKQVSTEVARLLNEARPHAQTWQLHNLDWNALLPDLTAVYRAGRKALRETREEQSDESFHDFRKCVKQHWYHVRLLESVWDSDLKKRAAALRELETCLGDGHNLAVLRTRIMVDMETTRDRRQARHFVALLEEEAHSLRRQASAIAERLYAEKPSRFAARIASLWTPVRKAPPAFEPLHARSAVA